jgi:hypothetical protein
MYIVRVRNRGWVFPKQHFVLGVVKPHVFYRSGGSLQAFYFSSDNRACLFYKIPLILFTIILSTHMEPCPRPRLFALIIGINSYNEVGPLHGAVPDALSVKDYLENSLKVPTHQIHMLLDKSASRSAIIEAFKSFRGDRRIQEGDPIFIYFAGHGGELLLPESEVGSKIQLLVPQDCCATPEKKIPAIPDRTIGSLIAQIAEKKGDNIVSLFHCSSLQGNTYLLAQTFVLDCCRCPGLGVGIYDLDFDRDILKSARKCSCTPPDLLYGNPSSHVLISACSSSERAHEVNSRGSFSMAFLKLLYSVSPDELRYRDILEHMDTLPQ